MQSFIIPEDETPEQARQRRMSRIAQALGQPMPSGAGASLDALGQAILARKQQQDKLFPAAPGGAKPSFMTAMGNMFGPKKGLF